MQLLKSRSMALVLLRRLVASSYEEFFRDSQIQKDHFHSEFIRYLSAEQQPVLKKRLTDILAELARNTIGLFFEVFHYSAFFRRKYRKTMLDRSYAIS